MLKFRTSSQIPPSRTTCAAAVHRGSPAVRDCAEAIVELGDRDKAAADNIWKDAALIWEDSKGYLYARPPMSGRIIIGEDSEEVIEPDARDALIPQKAKALTGSSRRCSRAPNSPSNTAG